MASAFFSDSPDAISCEDASQCFFVEMCWDMEHRKRKGSWRVHHKCYSLIEAAEWILQWLYPQSYRVVNNLLETVWDPMNHHDLWRKHSPAAVARTAERLDIETEREREYAPNNVQVISPPKETVNETGD